MISRIKRAKVILMKRGERIESILQRCLARIEAGDGVDACLRDFPEQADDLRPLLEAALQLRRWEPPALSDAARATARARARDTFTALPAPPRRWTWGWGGGKRLALRSALALLLVVGTLGIGVAAAQSSLPGQPLYSLKRQSEQIRLQFTSDAERQAELRLEFAGHRLNEALALLANCTHDPEPLNDLAQEYD
jgi:hypothetical protein